MTAEAFERQVAKLRPLLLRYAYKRRFPDVEDVVQSAISKAWRLHPTIELVAFKHYMFRAVANEGIGAIRKSRPYASLEDIDGITDGEDLELSVCVQGFLESLSEEQREAVLGRMDQEKNFLTASKIGISRSSEWRRIVRARQQALQWGWAA